MPLWEHLPAMLATGTFFFIGLTTMFVWFDPDGPAVGWMGSGRPARDSGLSGPAEPEASERLRRRLLAGIHKVARSPKIGHSRSDLTSRPLRFRLVRPYLIVYEPDSRPLRVVHSAQDMSRQLDG